ncbi:MAG: acylphosphatase [Alphaproteobacteria bacterium]|nr:acylphosphatase [Alphaproteobacteria bacterium]
MKTSHVRISGRVQGVRYRAWAVEQAVRLGVTGWVRNRADGTVEAVFQGSEAMVKNMIEMCRQGPSGAKVGGLTVEPMPPQDFYDFKQRATE